MKNANPPLLRSIEPGVRALVDALNATRLVHTFTSCEGHYGYRAPEGDFTDRERANVGFFLRAGASEDALVRFFGRVLADYDRYAVEEIVFTVEKRYAAALDPADGPEAFFEFTMRPRNRGAPDAAKRSVTDRALAVITACVTRAAGAAPVQEIEPRAMRMAS
jgi:hypothetical protein